MTDCDRLAAHWGMPVLDLLAGPTHALTRLPADRVAIGGMQTLLPLDTPEPEPEPAAAPAQPTAAEAAGSAPAPKQVAAPTTEPAPAAAPAPKRVAAPAGPLADRIRGRVSERPSDSSSGTARNSLEGEGQDALNCDGATWTGTAVAQMTVSAIG
ncbi:hypothetical protein [Streptomyces sp. NPDC058674]|uniref:hypothetical protein n=1 Tax=Streptomyces sp. NPDC058674 TaxID=3346592 RepID=UPI003664A63A